MPKAKTDGTGFDFICPSCCVARSRNAILGRCGLLVVELPFQVHPEIPAEGVAIGPRSGEVYLCPSSKRSATRACQLRWPSRLPNSRYAVAVVEWGRRHHLLGFDALSRQLFKSHFESGEDIGDVALVDRYAALVDADTALIPQATSRGTRTPHSKSPSSPPVSPALREHRPGLWKPG